MVKDKANESKTRRRGRKWLAALGIAAVLLVGGLFLVEQLIQPNRYRPEVEKRLSAALALPTTVDEIDLAFFPVPSVHARGLKVGEGDLRCSAEDIRASLRLRSLLRGRVDVSSVTVYGLSVTLPEDTARVREHWTLIKESRKAPQKKASKLSVSRVRARGASIFIGESKEPLAVADVIAHDVLSDSIALEIEARVSAMGARGRCEGDLTLERRRGEDPAVVPSGTLRVRGLTPPAGKWPKDMPVPRIDVEATVAEFASGEVQLALTGKTGPAKGQPDDAGILEGSFAGRAWWKEGSITVNELVWKGLAGECAADLTRSPDGALACSITSASLSAEGIDAALQYLPTKSFRLKAGKGAKADFSEVLFGVSPGEKARLVRGSIQFADLTPSLAKGAAPFGALSGSVRIEEGVFHLEDVKGTGLSVGGTIHPDFAEGAMAVDVAGSVQPPPALLNALLTSPAVKELGGRLELDRLTGTFVRGAQGLPEDLAAEGRLEDGLAGIETAALKESLTNVAGRFRLRDGMGEATLSADSVLLGKVNVDSRYRPGEKTVRATITADLSKLAFPALQGEFAQRAQKAVLEAYGPSVLDVAIELPSEENGQCTISASRKEEPAFDAKLTFTRAEEGWAPGPLEGRANLPLVAVQSLLPEHVAAEGVTRARVTWPGPGRNLVMRADLSNAVLGFDPYLRKESGVAAEVEAEIPIPSNPAKPLQVGFTCGGETVRGRVEKGRFQSDIDVALAAFSGLFMGEQQASGRVTGSIATAPFEAHLTLEDCTFTLGGGIAVDSVSGSLDRSPGKWAAKSLKVQGLNSDCVVSAEYAGSACKGSVTGKQVDLNAVLGAWTQAKAFVGGKGEGAGPQASAAAPLDLDFHVALGSVLLRGAQMKQVRTHAVSEGPTIHLRDLSFVPGTGRIDGIASYTRRGAGQPGLAKADLRLQQADAQFLDALLFETPRELKGLVDGTVVLEAPFGAGANPLHGATGQVEFTAANGTLGKSGLATRLLTLLRTTEIIRLRLPSLKDQGLTYDTCSGKLSIKQGYLTLEEYVLRSPTMALAAAGTVDFPHDTMNLAADVHLLGLVTGLLEIVPGLQKPAEEVRQHTSFPVSITGSPKDPKASFVRRAEGEEAREQLREVSPSREDMLGGILRDSAREALRRILGDKK